MSNAFNEYKIYGRNRGRKNIKFLDYSFYKKFLIDLEKDLLNFEKIIIDIGSGSGENSLFLAKKNPDKLIIASEVFKDGNINLCNQLLKLKIKNVKLFSENAIKLFEKLKKENFIEEIWILFPDPWPKKRHQKRRLIDIKFFKIICSFLNNGSKVFIATDSTSYLFSIINSIYEMKLLLRWENDRPYNWLYKYYDLPNTKFYRKAENSYRSSFFIKLIKI